MSGISLDCLAQGKPCLAAYSVMPAGMSANQLACQPTCKHARCPDENWWCHSDWLPGYLASWLAGWLAG